VSVAGNRRAFRIRHEASLETPFRLQRTRSGYEASEYKALAALFDQMRLSAEKTIANYRKSAHAVTMSAKHHDFVRSFAGLPA
jgi:hypothetical protein